LLAKHKNYKFEIYVHLEICLETNQKRKNDRRSRKIKLAYFLDKRGCHSVLKKILKVVEFATEALKDLQNKEYIKLSE